MATYRKLGDKTNTVYMDGKAPKKDKAEDDFIYLDIQIYELVNCLGTERAIKYLQNKIKQIKKMQGGDK